MRQLIVTLFGAAAVAVAFAPGALAADMPAKAPAYFQPAGYNWSGFYVGLNAGAAFGRAHDQTTTVFDPVAGYFGATSVSAIASTGDLHTNKVGFTGGIQAGYNWQINSTVFGLETDFNYMGVKASTTSVGVYPCCAPTSFTINQSAKTDWLFTLRPREP
jgi:outer membrane immunogenic protein